MLSVQDYLYTRLLKTSPGRIPKGHGFATAITKEVLSYSAGKNLFPGLHNHVFETTVDDNHVHTLVKMAPSIHCTIRMHHLAKRETES